MKTSFNEGLLVLLRMWTYLYKKDILIQIKVWLEIIIYHYIEISNGYNINILRPFNRLLTLILHRSYKCNTLINNQLTDRKSVIINQQRTTTMTRLIFDWWPSVYQNYCPILIRISTDLLLLSTYSRLIFSIHLTVIDGYRLRVTIISGHKRSINSMIMIR